jgi:hypothetical protein
MAKTSIDRRWLPLNALRAFEGVAKHLSFTLSIHPDALSDTAIALFRSWLIERFGMS